MDVLNKSISLIDDIINNTDTKTLNFYQNVLEMMSSLYENKYNLSIFFSENTNYILKSAIKKGKLYDKNYQITFNLENFIESNNKTTEQQLKEDELLLKHNFIVKLMIKNSIFGFMILGSDKELDNSTKKSFEMLVNIISYKIKDYELAEVFKIQLKALEEAIVEKENAYEIIKKQHKKLQELDKTKSMFLANISHELRTPLNAIIGFSQALDSKIFGDLNEKQAEYIKDIQVSSLHLLGMINEILDISKFEANAMKYNESEIEPTRVIQEVINILEPLYQNKKIEVKFNSNFDGIIKADYQKMQQILYNLLSNAIKFTQENGKIEITQENNGKTYILKIKDNGVGIDKKYHNKIFKKFTHINNSQSNGQLSTGLGLTITKELVKLHKGKITLESEVNKGTTFTLEFKKMVI